MTKTVTFRRGLKAISIPKLIMKYLYPIWCYFRHLLHNQGVMKKGSSAAETWSYSPKCLEWLVPLPVGENLLPTNF